MTQPKVLKAEEYCMYFPLSELHGWGKRFAASRRRFIQRFLSIYPADRNAAGLRGVFGMNYDYAKIEAKWHKYWQEHNTFYTDVRRQRRDLIIATR